MKPGERRIGQRNLIDKTCRKILADRTHGQQNVLILRYAGGVARPAEGNLPIGCLDVKRRIGLRVPNAELI
jgi:hypothetical protein